MIDAEKYFEHKEDLADCVSNWEDFLDAFSQTMLPVAKRYGISFGEALVAFKLNQVYNELCGIKDDPY
jgi:hypothetical protein